LLDGPTKEVHYAATTITSVTRKFAMPFTRVSYKELMECLQSRAEMACYYGTYTTYPHYAVYRNDIRKLGPSNSLEALVIVEAV
jgi:hypothetical protein